MQVHNGEVARITSAFSFESPPDNGLLHTQLLCDTRSSPEVKSGHINTASNLMNQWKCAQTSTARVGLADIVIFYWGGAFPQTVYR